MAKKVKLQNVLTQLRKCVDHPYLFDGEGALHRPSTSPFRGPSGPFTMSCSVCPVSVI